MERFSLFPLSEEDREMLSIMEKEVHEDIVRLQSNITHLSNEMARLDALGRRNERRRLDTMQKPNKVVLLDVIEKNAKERKKQREMKEAEESRSATAENSSTKRSILVPVRRMQLPVMATRSDVQPLALHCMCRAGPSGKMIQCANPDCKVRGWFHLSCYAMGADEGRKMWLCPACLAHEKK